MRLLRYKIVSPNMIFELRTKTDARSINKPKSGPFWLPLRNLQALALPYSDASSTTLSSSFSCSGFSTGLYRCVDLIWPIVLHARRSLIFSSRTTIRTASLRFAGLRSFPWTLPSKSSCLGPDRPRSFSIVHFLALVPSDAWLDRLAFRRTRLSIWKA